MENDGIGLRIRRLISLSGLFPLLNGGCLCCSGVRRRSVRHISRAYLNTITAKFRVTRSTSM